MVWSFGRMNSVLAVVVVSTFMAAQAAEDGSQRADTAGPKIESHGAFGWNFGKLLRGSGSRADLEFDDQWLQNFVALEVLETKFSEQLSARVGVGVLASYPLINVSGNLVNGNYNLRIDPLLIEAQIQYKFGDPSNPFLQINGGYLPFKYNPYVRNLGLYLFRGSTYPANIESGFEARETVPLGHLLGIKTHLQLFKVWSNDILLTSEVETRPFYDFSLAYVAGVKAIPSLDIGTGVNFVRLIPVDNRLTTPGTDPKGGLAGDNGKEDGEINFYFIDSSAVVTPDTTYMTYDTTNYTHRGVKLMARFAWDPKVFLKNKTFGPNDLVLYGEVALIGAKNYPLFYEKIDERIPFMIGLNIPTFKMLDVLAFELEYFSSPYKYDYERVSSSPVSPTPRMTDYNEPVHTDDWKWSLYASKTIAKIINLKLQVACDHSKFSSILRNTPVEQSMSETFYEDENGKSKGFPHLKDWYWMAQLGFVF